jgi:hypothetical protein
VPESGARNVFFYLLMFLNLYLSAIGAIMLTWGLADLWFTDPLQEFSDGSSSVRSGIAMVVVAFPAFLYLARYVRQNIAPSDAIRKSLIRRILTYLTLFVVALTAIVDVITLIYNFLGGDLTGRFAVRALGILVVSGLVLLYYLIDQRPAPEPAATEPATA